MRKYIIPAIGLSATMAAAPASAQSWGQRHNQHSYQQGRHIEQQLQQLANRIRRAEDRDLISEREEDRLMRQLRNIGQRYDRFRRNGLTRYEHQDIQSRIHQLRQRLQFERREGRYDNRRDRW